MTNNVIVRKWKNTGLVKVDNLSGITFTGESGAHTFVIQGYDANNQKQAISGAITGKFWNKFTGITVPLTGSIVDGDAVVTLVESCYADIGLFMLTLYATNGGTDTCIYCGVGSVIACQSDVIAYPTAAIPDVADLIVQIQDIIDSIPNDYSSLQTKVSALMREGYWASGKLLELGNVGYVEGYYKDYNTGEIFANADYCYSDNIYVLPDSEFKIINANNDMHVTYWDVAGNYISGELLGGTYGDRMTIPQTCDSVVLSYVISERNSIALTYLNNILSVGVGRQFATISEAVFVANDGDTILIYPGVYNETIDATAKKLYFKGVSKKSCILTYSANNYAYPPLSIAKGGVENMTIYASWAGDTTYDRAYCAHIDSDYERGETLSFDNVDFITERGHCVGIGTRTDFHLKFTDCLFHSKYGAQYGCIYNHDSEYESDGIHGYNVYENQSVEYINCTMINETVHYTIVLQSQERLESCCKITFIGNQIIQPANNEKTVTMVLYQSRTLTNNHYLGSSDFVLTDISGLNTDTVLGYTDLYDIATVAETQQYLGL